MLKYLFIVNPISGGSSKNRILRLLDQFSFKYGRPIEICLTNAKGDAVRLAHDSDADVIVAVGGDGTVHEVAQGLLGSNKTMGILPCGSGNGLAFHLGISRNPRKAIQTLLSGNVSTIDYGQLDEQPFFCTIGMGLDAQVAWVFAASTKRGLRTYASIAWRAWHSFKPMHYSITIDGEEETSRAVLLTAGNANQWGNNAKITSLASVQDSMIDLCIVEPFKTIEIPVLAFKLFTGRLHTSQRVRMLRGRNIIIRRQHDGPVHCDGDPIFKGTTIRITCIPTALNVIVPKDRISY